MSEIESLLSRKKQLEELPPAEFKKFNRLYQIICNQIDKQKETWNEDAALKLLLDTNEEINNLGWKQVLDLLSDNSTFQNFIRESTKNIDKAFEMESMEEVRKAISYYKTMCFKFNTELVKRKMKDASDYIMNCC
jgi:hypothetical protein